MSSATLMAAAWMYGLPARSSQQALAPTTLRGEL
jgi:hypothetical protein